jgi:hypothetical protein
MRKLIALSALVAIVTLCWPTSRTSAVPVPTDKPVRWEYAELHSRNNFQGAFGQPGKLAPVPQTAVRWITVEEEIEATSWEDLAAKLKARGARKDADIQTHKLRVLNQLGADGWELVGQSSAATSSATGIWTFKRRVP